MHNNDIFKFQYNQWSCKDASLLFYGRMTSPSFKAKVPKNAKKQISDEALKIASAAIAASGIVYFSNTKVLSLKQQEEIIEKYKQGTQSVVLANEYSCSKSTIINLIKNQPNKKELQELNKKNRSVFPQSVQEDIINMYVNGATYEKIAKKYKCNKITVCKFFGSLPNKKEIREQHFNSLCTFNSGEINEITDRYKNGESFNAIAKDFDCSRGVIQRLIDKQENSEDLRNQNKQNRTFLKPAQKKEIIERFANGETGSSLAREYKCSKKIIQILINEQPNAEELKEQSKSNRHFTQEQKEDVILMFRQGISYEKIASKYECSETVIKKLISEQSDVEQLKDEHETNRQFLPEQRNLIIDKYKSGMSYEVIAKELGSTKDIVKRFILNLPDIDELKELHRENSTYFSAIEKQEIIERYINGESTEAIAVDYSTYGSTIRSLLKKQANIEEIKELHYKNTKTMPRSIILPEQESEILNKYISGESCGQIAIKLKCSYDTIRKFIKKQDNAEEIILMHKQNNSLRLQNREKFIIGRYKEGASMELIAKEMDCARGSVSYLIYKRPDIEDIQIEHQLNSERFNDDEIQDIIKRRADGESCAQIARTYKTTSFIVWNIIQKELNTRLQDYSKETSAHKYETYSIEELKTRISEFISLKQVEENDELLDIMYFLDEKSKMNENTKKLSIQFVRLLDKLELQQITIKKIMNSETIKNLFDLMDKELIRQQVFEELNKDFNTVIDDLNSCSNEALGDICSKYIAHNIDDEDNIASMKTILNIISSNDEKSVRHKLVAFDNMKQNPNDEIIKETEELYGKENQEKIGQYIIFDKLLNGDFTCVDFNNDALKFVDELKTMHLNKEVIIKRLIELEDYFNSEEAKNNSLTNFIKRFNSNDNYINKLLTDFYIDNIYKDKITTIEVIGDSKYSGGENITLMIYPEAKQATLSNTEVNINKHQFLIDSEEYAHNFASRKFGSLGLKIFTLDKSYQKEGFYSGENVLEIKVNNGHNGARLAAKIKNEDDRVFEIKYFMPKGFHKEKKRTDL